jgi:hypothetical protein
LKGHLVIAQEQINLIFFKELDGIIHVLRNRSGLWPQYRFC